MEFPVLPMTSYMLLSLLLFQKFSDAMLRQHALQGHNDCPALLTPSQLDTNLRHLTQQGFVTGPTAAETPDSEPVYSITPKGEAAVCRWLMHTPVTDDGSAEVSLAHIPWRRLVPPQAIIPLIEAHRQQCLDALVVCEAQTLWLPQTLGNNDADERTFLPSLALQCRIAELRTDIAWAEHTLAQLRHHSRP